MKVGQQTVCILWSKLSFAWIGIACNTQLSLSDLSKH